MNLKETGNGSEWDGGREGEGKGKKREHSHSQIQRSRSKFITAEERQSAQLPIAGNQVEDTIVVSSLVAITSYCAHPHPHNSSMR